MEGIFPIFIVFIIIIGIVNSVIVHKSSSSSQKATQTLEKEKYKLFAIENRILNIQEKIESLLEEDSGDTGAVAVPVAKLLKEFYDAHKEYEKQVKTFDSAQQNAYEALNNHRMAQNAFGGGADDLGAFSYYENEKNYHKAAYARGVRVDGILIMRATEYVRAHSDRLAYMEDDTAIEESEQRYIEAKYEEVPSSRKNELPVYAAENAWKGEKRSGGLGKKVAIAASILAVVGVIFAFGTMKEAGTDPMEDRTAKHVKLQPLSTAGYEDNSYDASDDETEIANEDVVSENTVEGTDNTQSTDNTTGANGTHGTGGSAGAQGTQGTDSTVGANEIQGTDDIWVSDVQGTDSAAAVQGNETAGPVTYWTIGRYNMRADVNGAVVRTLDAGTVCYGTGNTSADNKWVEISLTDGTVGWIYREGLAAADNQQAVSAPVAEPVNNGANYRNDEFYENASTMFGVMQNVAEQMGGDYAGMADNFNADTYMELFNSMASGF